MNHAAIHAAQLFQQDVRARHRFVALFKQASTPYVDELTKIESLREIGLIVARDGRTAVFHAPLSKPAAESRRLLFEVIEHCRRSAYKAVTGEYPVVGMFEQGDELRNESCC